VYLEVGWRLGLPVGGVNFPGHFLVRYEGVALRILVDPFQAGELRFEDEAQELLDRVYGGSVSLLPEFLRSAGKRDIIARILSNLKGIYLNARDDARALAAADRLLQVHRDDPEELRDRGMILFRLGRVAEAITDLRTYLERVPGAPDARRVEMLLERLRPD
jgi:regulator of sirC expression with transglutaminase-like and TPR domain